MGTTVPPSKWIRICPDSPEDMGGGKEQEDLPQVRDSRYAEAAAPKITQCSEKVKTKLLWILGVVWFVAPLVMSAYSLSLSHRNNLVLQQQAKAKPSTQNEAGIFHPIRGIGQLQAYLNQQRDDISVMRNILNARTEQLQEQQQQMNGSIVYAALSVASDLLELERQMNITVVDVGSSMESDLLEQQKWMNHTIAGVRLSMDSKLREQQKRMNGAIAGVRSFAESSLLELKRQVNSTMVDVGIFGQSADLRNLAARIDNLEYNFDRQVQALQNKLQLLDVGDRTHAQWPPSNIKTSINRRPPSAKVKTSSSQKRGTITQANSHSSSSSRTGTGGRNGVATMIVNKLLLSCGCILTMMMRTSC